MIAPSGGLGAVGSSFGHGMSTLVFQRTRHAVDGLNSTTSAASPNARTPRTTAIRQSPPRRSAPKVDPEELRRELAGSYPAPAASGGPSDGGPVARVARANNGAANNEPAERAAEEPEKSNTVPEEATLEPTAWIVTLEADAKDRSGAVIHYVIEGKIENLELPDRSVVGTWRSERGGGAFEMSRQ